MATEFYLTDNDPVEEPVSSPPLGGLLGRPSFLYTVKGGSTVVTWESLEQAPDDASVETGGAAFDAGTVPQSSMLNNRAWVSHPMYAGSIVSGDTWTFRFRAQRSSNPNWGTFYTLTVYIVRPATGEVVAKLIHDDTFGFPVPTGTAGYIGNLGLNAIDDRVLFGNLTPASWLDGDVLVVEPRANTIGNTGGGSDSFRYGANDALPQDGGDAARFFTSTDITFDPPKAIGEVGGIATSETFGVPSVSGALTIPSIESREAFGIPAFNQPAGGFEPAPTRGPAVLSGEIPSRQETVEWRVVDLAGTPQGVLAVGRDQPVTISNDVGRAVRRQAGTLVVPSRPPHDRDARRIYAGEITNWSLYEVWPYWLLGTGDEYPLGRFRRATELMQVRSQGDVLLLTLWDRMKLLHRPMEEAYFIDAGQRIADNLRQLAADLGIAEHRIDGSDIVAKEPLPWPRATATYLDVFETGCTLLGFLPPYFTNTGVFICRGAPDFENATADHRYGLDKRVTKDTVDIARNDLNLPNRYEVTSSSSMDEPLFGFFEIPQDAPHSFYNNGGYWNVRLEHLQGLETDEQCADAARALYAADIEQAVVRTFDALPDPRHDTHDLIDFDGVLEREVAWTLTCKAGGPMRHETRRVLFS